MAARDLTKYKNARDAEINLAETQGFDRGVTYAAAFMVKRLPPNLRVLARELLHDSGLTLDDLRKSNADDADLKVCRRLLGGSQ